MVDLILVLLVDELLRLDLLNELRRVTSHLMFEPRLVVMNRGNESIYLVLFLGIHVLEILKLVHLGIVCSHHLVFRRHLHLLNLKEPHEISKIVKDLETYFLIVGLLLL